MKFTGFETHLIKQGLNIIKAKWIEDIKSMEADNKRPIMTTRFIEMTVKEALEKLEKLTFK